MKKIDSQSKNEKHKVVKKRKRNTSTNPKNQETKKRKINLKIKEDKSFNK